MSKRSKQSRPNKGKKKSLGAAEPASAIRSSVASPWIQADPPRANRKLLVVSLLLLAIWLVFLTALAMFG